MEDLAECFGGMCRAVLEEARTNGLFQKLPLAAFCRLAVEEQGGLYGWVEGGEEDDDEIKAALYRAARKTPKSKRVAFWIEQLEKLAQGTSPVAHLIDATEFVLEGLLELGEQSLVPLLQFTLRWADKPEFKAVGKAVEERPASNVLFTIFQTLEDEWEWAHPPAESLLQEFIRRAIKVKPVRNRRGTGDLYGTAPSHAAAVLHARFPGYPEPKRGSSTNQLLNAEQFTGKAKLPKQSTRRR